MASRRAVGSLIGIGFLLMIIAVGVNYYNLRTNVERQSNTIIQDMAEFDQQAADEALTIQYAELTPGNSLNLTIKNTGSIISQLEWIGVFDTTLNKEAYFRVDTSLNPLEIEKDIGNASIVMNPANNYNIAVLTRLGNIYYSEYPIPVTPGTEGGGGNFSSQYYTNYQSVDNHPETAVGTHSFFAAMKGQPNGVINTLIEGSPPAQAPNTTILINYESFEEVFPPLDWDENPPGNRWAAETDQAYDGIYSADFDGQANGRSGELLSPVFDTSDASNITLDFWYQDSNLDAGEFLLEFWDGANWDLIADLSNDPEDVWNNFRQSFTDPQYLIVDFQIRWRANDVEGGGETAYFDYVYLEKEVGLASTSYELDLEVEWTGLPQATYEYLSVYGGIQGAENLFVEVWDGSQYVTLIVDVQPGWNSVDVSTYHTNSTFNIRFKDATQLGDVVQENWEIDALFLNLWD